MDEPILFLLLFICCRCIFLQPVQSNNTFPPDLTAFIYKSCSDRAFPGPTRADPEPLSSFFRDLIAHSTRSKFFKITTPAVSGLFQCRSDLTGGECHNCVAALESAASAACGFATAAARVQLAGCYVRYEADGFEDPIGDAEGEPELLHKICGDPAATRQGAAAALREVENDVAERGVEGDWEVAVGGVRVRAQCEVGLGICECGECVGEGVRVAMEECGESEWGNVFTDKCFVGFYYNTPNGNSTTPDKKGGNNMGKIGAIGAGVAAALFFGFVFLKFIKSLGNKDDDF